MSVRGVTTIDALDRIGTYGFRSDGVIITTYTYDFGTGLIAATAVSPQYQMSLLDYLGATVLIDEWLAVCDKAFGPGNFPLPGPDHEREVKIDRLADICEMTLKIRGTKYAGVEWAPSGGLNGDVKIAARPAFSFDRTVFDVFIAAHRDFGATCREIEDGL